MTQNAFDDNPPEVTIGDERIKLRPMFSGFRKVFPILSEIYQGSELGNSVVYSFILLHAEGSPVTPSQLIADKDRLKSEIDALDWMVSFSDVQAVDAYLGRVFARLSGAQVETPEGEK